MKYLIAEPEKLKLLEDSFRKVSTSGEKFVERAYETLFERLPEARPYFNHLDMLGMRGKLLLTLTMMIENVRRPDILDGLLGELGARHIRKYRVPVDYLAKMGDVIVDTMAEFSGPEWTSELNSIWCEAMKSIIERMTEAGSQPISPN